MCKLKLPELSIKVSRNMVVKKAAKKAKILYKEDPAAKVCLWMTFGLLVGGCALL